MKIFLFALFFLLPNANAKEPLCEPGFAEVTTCVAEAWVPFYLFLSVCRDEKGYMMILDPGATRRPEPTEVDRVENESEIIFSSKDEQIDNMSLILEKMNDSKQEGTFRFLVWGVVTSHKYLCNRIRD